MNGAITAWPPAKKWPSHRIVRQLEQSALYIDYARAFGETTGLPLSMAITHNSLLVYCSQSALHEVLARHHAICTGCQRSRQNAADDGTGGPRTFTDFAGLCESSVAIRSGEITIGFLRTGAVATRKPTAARFARIAQHLKSQGTDFDESELKRAYLTVRVIPLTQYNSILDLLTVFAGHLSLVAGQIALCNGDRETPNIIRARQFIDEHKGEPLELKQVAESACMSSCYFCKKFKEATGFTFTEYLAQARVESAKHLLLNPQTRVSEVAFEVGFQSITHFNRVFKAITGQCATKYREGLRGIASKPDSRSFHE